jgi:hypothetical protein
MRTLEKAASDQLTGSRPGILCVKLEGLAADDLIEIAESEGPPTALRIGVHGSIGDDFGRKTWNKRCRERQMLFLRTKRKVDRRQSVSPD